MELSVSRWNSESPEKAKIVLLHGMGGTGLLWRPIAALLEKDYTVIAPDQRGHGKSRPVPGDGSVEQFTPLQYASDVIETLSLDDDWPVYVIGHSMGVRTAAAMGFLKPQSIQGMILVDLGLSGLAGGSIGNTLAKFLGILPKRFPTREQAREFLTEHCPDAAIAQYLMAVMFKVPTTDEFEFPFDNEVLQKTIQAAQHLPLDPWLTEYSRKTEGPILILRGEKSGIYSRTVFEEEQIRFKEFKNITFQEFSGAGHGLPFEKRIEFIECVRKFCQ